MSNRRPYIGQPVTVVGDTTVSNGHREQAALITHVHDRNPHGWIVNLKVFPDFGDVFDIPMALFVDGSELAALKKGTLCWPAGRA